MNRKIKVLLVVPDFTSGIGAMARHLAKSVRGVDYYFYKSSDISKKFEAFLRLTNSVDIIHWLANLSWINFPESFDLKTLSIPCIATIHHVDERLIALGEVQEQKKVRMASICDAIQVVSAEWVDYVASRTKSNVFLAHHAIDPKQFIGNRIKKRPSERFKIGTFGYARTMTDHKRIDIMLKALVELKNQGYCFDLIVQGPNWDELLSNFSHTNINVKNLGYRSTKKALRSYRYLDLYICSSDVEGGPLTVLEALASRVPVVSTKVGVAREALAIGGGILVDKNNPKQLASAIATLINKPDVYKKCVNETIQVSKNFSWKCVGEEYKKMYEFVNNHKKSLRKVSRYYIPVRLQRAIQINKEEKKILSTICKVLGKLNLTK